MQNGRNSPFPSNLNWWALGFQVFVNLEVQKMSSNEIFDNITL